MECTQIPLIMATDFTSTTAAKLKLNKLNTP